MPLDFFSWHCYTTDASELTRRAQAIRGLLNAQGFTNTESHLNEWNFLPGNTWLPLSRDSPADARQEYYDAMAGAPGAAFIVAALLELQDAPVDVCNLYHGELGGFGLFNEHGVPQKNYYGLRAFRELLNTPRRVEAGGGVPGKLAIVAGLNADGTEASVLVANVANSDTGLQLATTHLPWSGRTIVETSLVDKAHDLDLVGKTTNATGNAIISLPWKSPVIVLVRMRPAAK